MRGRDLADRVARHLLRHQPERLQQPEHRHLEGEQRGLRVPRLFQRGRVRTPHHRAQRRVEVREGRVEGGGEDREPGVQLTSHAKTLRSLTGEQERERGLVRGHTPRELGAVRQHHGPLLERRPRGRQRERDVQRRQGIRDRLQPDPLFLQGSRGAAGQNPRQHSGSRRRRGLDDQSRCLLEDHVRVRARHTERGDTGARRPVDGRPRSRVVQQGHGALGPVDLGGRCAEVQGLRQQSVLQRHDDLDHPGDTRGALGVADVGLHRPEVERLGPVLAVDRQNRLRLDRVTQRRAGAVGLDGVHIGRCQSAVLQSLPDDALLRRPVRRGQSVGGAVLVDGGTADDGEDLVAGALSVRKALQHQHTDALGPAGAVRVVGERLAAPVSGEPALRGEGGEPGGRRHDRDTTGQRQVALTTTQRLGREVQRHERRRARGVDGDGGAFQPEQVGDAAGQHGGGEGGRRVEADVLARAREQVGVVLRRGAHEHAGPGAAQRLRVHAGAFQCLPGGFEKQALLRVHDHGFTGRDAEEPGVERRRVFEEAAFDRGGVEFGDVPPAIGREPADHVPALGDDLPEVLRRGHPSGVPAPDAHDRDRFHRCRDQLLVLLAQPVDLLQ